MKEQAKTPVFQEDDGTWSHLTKLVNPLICTIEYGRRTGFSSREEAEESYQRSLVSYHDQLSKLKKERDMPFTFSEYLDSHQVHFCDHLVLGKFPVVADFLYISTNIQIRS